MKSALRRFLDAVLGKRNQLLEKKAIFQSKASVVAEPEPEVTGKVQAKRSYANPQNQNHANYRRKTIGPRPVEVLPKQNPKPNEVITQKSITISEKTDRSEVKSVPVKTAEYDAKATGKFNLSNWEEQERYYLDIATKYLEIFQKKSFILDILGVKDIQSSYEPVIAISHEAYTHINSENGPFAIYFIYRCLLELIKQENYDLLNLWCPFYVVDESSPSKKKRITLKAKLFISEENDDGSYDMYKYLLPITADKNVVIGIDYKSARQKRERGPKNNCVYLEVFDKNDKLWSSFSSYHYELEFSSEKKYRVKYMANNPEGNFVKVNEDNLLEFSARDQYYEMGESGEFFWKNTYDNDKLYQFKIIRNPGQEN